MDLRNGINMAVDSVIAHLKGRAWMISTSEEITQVENVVGMLISSVSLFLCVEKNYADGTPFD